MPDFLPYLVEPMALADVDQVMAIEQVSFSAPWSARAYRFEIAENQNGMMLVVRAAPSRRGLLGRLFGRSLPGFAPVLGYAGMWLLVDDAHVATIAVDPAWRGRGLGELLMLSLLERGRARGMRRATLEVRVSNVGAQALYLKLGFETVSRRRRYYADNDEDAFIMSTPTFDTPGFWDNLERCRAALHRRLAAGEARTQMAGTPGHAG